MKLALSSIAWDESDNDYIIALLKDYGVDSLEVAPGKVSAHFLEGQHPDNQAYLDYWQQQGFSLIAMQSLLYQQAELQIFVSEQSRQAMKDYLHKIFKLAHLLGTQHLVFGSPKNRQKNDLTKTEADDIAQKFFTDLGNLAHEYKLNICIEPNPEIYACDYLTSFKEALDFVRLVDHPQVKVHVDSGCFFANEDSFSHLNRLQKAEFTHVHLSVPWLEPVSSKYPLDGLIDFLRSVKYSGHISLEIKPAGDTAACRDAIKNSLMYVTSLL